MKRRPPRSTLFPYTPLSLSVDHRLGETAGPRDDDARARGLRLPGHQSGGLVAAGHDDGVRRRVEGGKVATGEPARSEEHTSELQSRQYLVCRLLLEKKTKSP